MERDTRNAIEQCGDLMRRGAPGILFYSPNRTEAVRRIWAELKDNLEQFLLKLAAI